MQYLLHGDDTSASRKRLTELTDGFNNSYFEASRISLRDFETALASVSLFESKEAKVFENLFSKNKNKKPILEFFKKKETQDLIIFWEGKKVIKTAFSSLKNIKVEEYNLPQVYFEFLDNFTPQRVTALYQMYHLLLLSTDPTQVFYSLIKRLRALLIIQSGGRSLEIERISPWQLSKLKNQARLWPKEKLSKVYKKLQDIEIRLKSGGLPLGLSQQLDILILSELN